MKMEMHMAISIVLPIWRSPASCAAAGATILEEMGEMKVNSETTVVAAHFRRLPQLHELQICTKSREYGEETHFRGFFGSSGPSQSTITTFWSFSSEIGGRCAFSAEYRGADGSGSLPCTVVAIDNGREASAGGVEEALRVRAGEVMAWSSVVGAGGVGVAAPWSDSRAL
jgi:hypothetical protein